MKYTDTMPAMNFEPQIVGYIAGFLTTVSFVPQLWLTLRTRNTEALSLGMYSAFTLGVALWFTYGVLQQDYALIVANGLTLIMAATILAIKLANLAKGEA